MPKRSNAKIADAMSSGGTSKSMRIGDDIDVVVVDLSDDDYYSDSDSDGDGGTRFYDKDDKRVVEAWAAQTVEDFIESHRAKRKAEAEAGKAGKAEAEAEAEAEAGKAEAEAEAGKAAPTWKETGESWQKMPLAKEAWDTGAGWLDTKKSGQENEEDSTIWKNMDLLQERLKKRDDDGPQSELAMAIGPRQLHGLYHAQRLYSCAQNLYGVELVSCLLGGSDEPGFSFEVDCQATTNFVIAWAATDFDWKFLQ
jgi:hypothetical protein